MNICRGIVITLLLVLPGSSIVAATSAVTGGAHADRTMILSYLIRHNLPRHHFSHKAINDDLSRTAFDLFLKQLDYQKRFLLKTDVTRLRFYADRIDDELISGPVRLPAVAYEIHNRRIKEARATVRAVLDAGFDVKRHEYLLTDPEKLEFAQTKDELKDRWRKIVKFQVINRFLNMEEDFKAESESSAEDGKEPAEPAEPAEPPTLSDAVEKIRESYDDYFDRLLRETEKDYLDRYFSAVARAYDPHTNYMPPTAREDFDITMRGSLEGIGATLREDDGYIKVVRIIPGSAAFRQGQLAAEDSILKVAEGNGEPVDITDMPLRKAVGLIRGKKGTEVRLTVKKPDGRVMVIPIVRDVVEIEETFVKSAVLESPGGRKIGYLKIPSFYRDFSRGENDHSVRNATDDTRNELESLVKAGVSAVVLDLRNNGGGALTDAINITGLFIDQGPVVQVKDSSGRIRIREDQIPGTVFDGPLLVLVNEFSASASEIVAGALQDYGRAVIVGSEHTHGKGTVQTVLDLGRTVMFPNMEKFGPLGAIKVTIQKFYRVNGGSTQFRGVTPDIVLPDVMQYMESGERYLDNPLPWDTVAKADFVPVAVTDAVIDRLLRASMERVSANAEFARIKDRAKRSKKKRDKHLQSLNIDVIRTERSAAAEEAEGETPSFLGHGAAAGAAPDASSSETDLKDKWLADLRRDPYIGEGMAILDDLFVSRTAAVQSGQAR